MRLHLLIALSCALISAFEYNLNYDRLELSYYDKSLVKDGKFLFRKHNRTNHCLNISFYLTKDLDGDDMKFTTTGYQLFSNQYKPVGFKINFNVCEYWKKNIYGTTKHLSQFGNLEGCDIKKGLYYLHNYMPDETRFPQYLPVGSYMVEIDVVWNNEKHLLKFEWYISAQFKLKRENTIRRKI